MEEVFATPQDVINYVSGEILGGPDDDIWDNIFDWIQSAISSITNVVVQWINSAISWITYNVRGIVNTAIASVTSLVSLVRSKLDSVWSYALNIYSKVSSWLTTAYSTVYSAATSAISVVRTWLSDTATNIISWVTTAAGSIKTWITTAFSSFMSSINSWFTNLWAQISGTLTSWWSTLTTWWNNLTGSIATLLTSWWANLTTWWGELLEGVKTTIGNTLGAWWGILLAKVFDFPSWVGKLLDAVWGWFSEDIPGSSPRWESIFKAVFPMFGLFFKDTWRGITTGYSEADFNTDMAKMAWLNKVFGSFFTNFLERIQAFSTAMGTASPEGATGTFSQLVLTGVPIITGLAAMTVAGELLHPLKTIGLGNISAMIFDMTNYKTLTGAFLAALTVAAVRTPLTHHFNDIFRPNLPRKRDADDLFSRDLIARGEYGRLLAYEGFPDSYHDKFADMAYRPASLYTLSALATTGIFDEKLFGDNLRDWGLRPDMRALFLTMYKAKATETVKGMMSGVAMTRYKEGYTTESQFTSELQILGYTAQEIPMYLQAAQIGYATDYLTDMKTAYTDAVRKCFISLDEYRDDLLGLGIVPERVNSFVIRQRIYLKPTEKPTAVAPPKPVYETDQGKIQVDTIRRRRMKETITRDEEIADLLGLGMPVDYAEAIADNDDIRLAEKVELEPPKIPLKYETEAGKVEVDTLRRKRRANLITQDEEIAGLLKLEMQNWLAKAIADNDTLRIPERLLEE